MAYTHNSFSVTNEVTETVFEVWYERTRPDGSERTCDQARAEYLALGDEARRQRHKFVKPPLEPGHEYYTLPCSPVIGPGGGTGTPATSPTYTGTPTASVSPNPSLSNFTMQPFQKSDGSWWFRLIQQQNNPNVMGGGARYHENTGRGRFLTDAQIAVQEFPAGIVVTNTTYAMTSPPSINQMQDGPYYTTQQFYLG